MEVDVVNKINALLEAHEAEKAGEMCREMLAEGSVDADATFWFLYGKAMWQAGHRAQAEALFRRAVELDSDSPARVALEMSKDISSFFNPDILNP